MANSFVQYRTAGAAARSCLIQAAAGKWGIDAGDVMVEDGMLKAGNKTMGFGDVIAEAAAITPPAEPMLKDPADFTLIGADKLPRKDNTDKTNGTAMFAMDVKVPNMLYVTILRSPKFGGTLTSFDAAAAASVNGFVDAKAMPDNSGVAIYANSTWASVKARRAITAVWDDTAADSRSSDQRLADYQSLLAKPPVFDATGKGDFQQVSDNVDAAEKSVTAEFSVPLLAHAPMEPLNCVLEPLEGGGIRIHDGCQFPSITHPTVAAITGVPAEQIEIKTYYAGGSFGRRANAASDYHAQAAMAYAMMGGQKAIKLVWMREDDLAGGYYRPQASHKAKVSVENGKVSGWAHHVAAQSIAKGTPFEQMLVHNGIDHWSVEGIVDTPYKLSNMSVGLTDFESPMTVLWWRSVGHSQNAFMMESLMDMAAEAAAVDPVEFRLAHLDAADEDNAKAIGWGGKPAKGMGRGFAYYKSFNSHVAQVMDVSVTGSGAISIDKVVCAVDCGLAVNPDIVRAQMEGGIGYGLGHIMRNQITLKDGVVEQQNFPQYQPLRIADMPEVETHIVASAEAPTGVGEPGLPPAGPALANAIYAATGKRVTDLPMTSAGITFA